jgi:hypothetical protein
MQAKSTLLLGAAALALSPVHANHTTPEPPPRLIDAMKHQKLDADISNAEKFFQLWALALDGSAKPVVPSWCYYRDVGDYPEELDLSVCAPHSLDEWSIVRQLRAIHLNAVMASLDLLD